MCNGIPLDYRVLWANYKGNYHTRNARGKHRGCYCITRKPTPPEAERKTKQREFINKAITLHTVIKSVHVDKSHHVDVLSGANIPHITSIHYGA